MLVMNCWCVELLINIMCCKFSYLFSQKNLLLIIIIISIKEFSVSVIFFRCRQEVTVIRMTEQRRVLFDILGREAWHPTVDELFLEAKKVLPKISLATVYRNLEGLIEDGLATKILTRTGAARFEKTKEPHAHFECLECGKVTDVFVDTECLSSIMKNTVLDNHEVQAVTVEIVGLCRSCRDKNVKSSGNQPKGGQK